MIFVMGVLVMRYKVVKKIICDEDCFITREDSFHKDKFDYLSGVYEKYGFIGYKIIAGLYIFYITPEIYEKALELDLIDEIDDSVENLNFEMMLMSRGSTVYHRMGYALQHSTIEYLTTELERINNELKVVNLKIYRAKWYKDEELLNIPNLQFLHEIRIDLAKMEVLKNTALRSKGDIISATLFKNMHTYEDFLDILVHYQDREFMNSRHIMDKFVDSEFYDVDYWMQRLYKFEISLED